LAIYDLRQYLQRLLRTSALMTGTCVITSTSSSVLSNDRRNQRTVTYISGETDTPCSMVFLRQLIYLFTNIITSHKCANHLLTVKFINT